MILWSDSSRRPWAAPRRLVMLKKQTVLKSSLRWKREKRKNIWDSKLYFTSEAKIYLLSKNIIYHKTLKRQKKANVAKTMDCGLFFLVKQISSFCFKKKMYINGGVKKRYQRWSEKKRYQRWSEKKNINGGVKKKDINGDVKNIMTSSATSSSF